MLKAGIKKNLCNINKETGHGKHKKAILKTVSRKWLIESKS